MAGATVALVAIATPTILSVVGAVQEATVVQAVKVAEVPIHEQVEPVPVVAVAVVAVVVHLVAVVVA